MSNTPQNASKLTFKEKLCYGLGDVSNGLAVSSVGFWLLIYLTDVAGLAAIYAGIAIMIGRVWDAITDPVMGWITDHTNTRWGKRRPYLLFGALPYGIAFFALWVIPDYQNQVFIFAYITVAVLVFNTCLTVVFVPYASMTASITSDYNERTSITGYRMMSSQVAFLVGAAVPSALVLWVSSPAGDEFLQLLGIRELFGSWALTPRAGYFIVSVLFSLIMVASILTAFWGTQERGVQKKPEPPKQQENPFSYASSILDELQGNRPFRLSVAILLLTNCATTTIAVSLPYFLQYALDMKAQQTSIIAVIFITAIFFVPIWVFVARRWGKAESYRVAMLFYIAVLCCMPLIGRGEVNFAYTVAFFAGVFQSAALILPWAMIPDVVEFDELKTGKRREGLFYGGTTFSYKFASALAIFLTGWVLEVVNYVPNQVQTAQVLVGIRSLIGPIPAVVLILAVFLAFRYPLDAKAHRRIVDELKSSSRATP